MLILTENRCTVCVERTIGSQIILDAPGALFAPNVPSAQKSFWTHLMAPIGDEAQVEDRFGLSDIVLILMQDRCTVCVEHTIALEIILDALDGTPR